MMRRIIDSKNAIDCGPGARRRGSLFHYYMMYLFLTSILLLSAGLCINAIMSADRTDQQESRHLKMLLRLEEKIRQDVLASTTVEANADELTTQSGSGRFTEWSIDRNVLVRQQRNGDNMVSSDRFVFRRSTQLAFREHEGGAGFILSITDPPRIPQSDNAADANSDATDRQSTEIILIPGRITLVPDEPSAEGGAA